VATRQLKFFEDLFIHFDRIRECDAQTNRRTDGQTPRYNIDRARLCTASRGKNRFGVYLRIKNSENLIVVARGQQYDELHDVVIHITDC